MDLKYKKSNLEKSIEDTFCTKKYCLYVTEVESVLNTIKEGDKSIKIEYISKDQDPAIYYYKDNKLYLVNYDSLEKKWYLSLIEADTLNLIEEIYSSNYVSFINYLKNKSH